MLLQLKSLEIEKARIEKWDGRYPTNVVRRQWHWNNESELAVAGSDHLQVNTAAAEVSRINSENSRGTFTAKPDVNNKIRPGYGAAKQGSS